MSSDEKTAKTKRPKVDQLSREMRSRGNIKLMIVAQTNGKDGSNCTEVYKIVAMVVNG